MNKPAIALLFLLGITVSVPALAGTVSGKVTLSHLSGNTANTITGEGAPVILWLVGTAEVPPPQTAITVSQRNLHFSPDFLVVTQGQKIDFPNDDNVVHNVFALTGSNQFNFGLYAKGEVKSKIFDTPGPVDLYCSVHHQMHAFVFVVPSRYFTTLLPGHTFTITNVPPGHYTLKVWHERSSVLVKPIAVPATGTVIQNLTLDNTPGITAAGGQGLSPKSKE